MDGGRGKGDAGRGTREGKEEEKGRSQAAGGGVGRSLLGDPGRGREWGGGAAQAREAPVSQATGSSTDPGWLVASAVGTSASVLGAQRAALGPPR